jgi:hypothetical protein
MIVFQLIATLMMTFAVSSLLTLFFNWLGVPLAGQIILQLTFAGLVFMGSVYWWVE